MSSAPTLSICIPTCNSASLLEGLLEHLLSIDALALSIEVILFDDASTDHTPQVIESYAERLPIRAYRQPSAVGPQANTVAAFRAARGLFCIYLADCDRLLPEALASQISFLTEHPEVVVLHAPWHTTDPQQESQQTPSHSLQEATLFDQTKGLDCFDFVVSQQWLPEIGIYRTPVLHKLLHRPHQVYVGFIMLFRAFRYGSVCFHPQPFYRSGARLDGGASVGPFGQLNETQSTAVIDRYRGSLEIALLSVLREFTPLPTPEAMCQQALLMINNFILGRLEVATKQSIARNDYCSAAEFTMRMLLWRTDTRAAEVEAWESSYLLKTALQAAVDVHGCNSTFAPLALCGLTDPEKTRAQLLQICPDLEVQTLDANEARGLAHPQSQLCLTDDKALREQLIADGMMPGHVLLLDDLIDQFSVLPRQFVQ